MKVILAKDYRKYYTLEDLDRAKMVIQYEKENDDYKIEDWVEYATNEIEHNNSWTWGMRKILDAEAHTARNQRVHDAYGEGTENMDVWIDFVVDLGNAIVKAGAYLSDIWQSGATPYYDHMYIEIFKRMGD